MWSIVSYRQRITQHDIESWKCCVYQNRFVLSTKKYIKELFTILWSCSSLIWYSDWIWFMTHIFLPNSWLLMLQELDTELQKKWIKLDDMNLCISWWVINKWGYNIWEQNIELIKSFLWIEHIKWVHVNQLRWNHILLDMNTWVVKSRRLRNLLIKK